MTNALQYAPDKVQKILVGNKSDEVDKRQVATEQGVKVGLFHEGSFWPEGFFHCIGLKNNVLCNLKHVDIVTHDYSAVTTHC